MHGHGHGHFPNSPPYPSRLGFPFVLDVVHVIGDCLWLVPCHNCSISFCVKHYLCMSSSSFAGKISRGSFHNMPTHLTEGAMCRWCGKESQFRTQIVSSFPAHDAKASGLPPDSALYQSDLLTTSMLYLEALLCQQGTPPSTATLSPTLRWVTPAPSSTTVLQMQVISS